MSSFEVEIAILFLLLPVVILPFVFSTNKKQFMFGLIAGALVAPVLYFGFPLAFGKYCQPKTIYNKKKVYWRYYYQMMDGSGYWSDKEFQIGDLVCVHDLEDTIISPLP